MTTPPAPQQDWQYQRTRAFFAATPPGMEEAAAAELEELGARGIRPAYAGIHFAADHAALYRIHYTTRLCTRILAPLIAFDCHDDRYLYKTAFRLDWPGLFSPEHTFAVRATVSQSLIRHDRFAALRLKDAVADSFRQRLGKRPSVSRTDPDVLLNLRIDRNHATISLDTSGRSLHKRGYRVASVEAPMQETVAAAIIRLSGWTGPTPLYDPMCGSGTLLAEALMSYCRLPAAYLNPRFGLHNLPDFNPSLWQKVKTACDAHIRPLPRGLLAGSDISPDAVHAARTNLRKLPGGENIALETKDYRAIPQLQNHTIVINPPHGIRLGASDGPAEQLKILGDFLKRRCSGSTAYVYLSDRSQIPHVGLRPAWKVKLPSGGLDGRLARFDLYRQSKKPGGQTAR